MTNAFAVGGVPGYLLSSMGQDFRTFGGLGLGQLGGYNYNTSNPFGSIMAPNYGATGMGTMGGMDPMMGMGATMGSVNRGNYDLSTPQGRQAYIQAQKEITNAQIQQQQAMTKAYNAQAIENNKLQLAQQKAAETQQFKAQATQVQLSQLIEQLHSAIAND